MARLSYREDAAGDERIAAGLATVENEYRRVGNLFKLLAHAPWLLPGVADLSVAVNRGDEQGVDPATKRPVHLAVSMQNSCDYCTTHNRMWATSAGVSAAKIEALSDGVLDSAEFTDAEQAAIAWAKSVAANNARRDIDSYERLRTHFTEAQIVELTVVAAYRTMINLLQEAFWTDLEDADTSAHEHGTA